MLLGTSVMIVNVQTGASNLGQFDGMNAMEFDVEREQEVLRHDQAEDGGALMRACVALLASPALHFLVLGALLVAADRWFARELPPIARGARVDRDRRARASRRCARAGLRARARRPTRPRLRALVEAEIDDEILLREARARGLEAGDPVVRARLARNLGFLRGEDERAARAGDARRVDEALALGLARSDLVVRRRLIERMRAELASRAAAKPSEAEIAARFARDRERLRGQRRACGSRTSSCRAIAAAPRSKPTHGASARSIAARGSRSSRRSRTAMRSCSATCCPPRTRGGARARVRRGVRARGRSRSSPVASRQPIASSYGLHLVLVHERSDGAPASLEAARARIEAELVREREAAALRGALAALRARYEIRVAGASS